MGLLSSYELPEGTALAVVVVIVLYVLVQYKKYMAWRDRIDKVGGPPAEIMSGTKKATGGLAGGNKLKFIREATKKYGGYKYRQWNGPLLPMVVLTHPDTVRPILSNKDSFKSKHMPRIFHHLGDSLLVQNGQKWRRSRKLLTPTFHFKVLRHYILETIDITSKMAETFAARPAAEAAKTVDLQEVIKELTLDILLKSIFSYDNASGETWGKEFTDATTACDEWVAKRIDHPLHILFDTLYFRSENGKAHERDAKVMHDTCRARIRERKAQHKELGDSLDKNGRLDFLDLILLLETGDGTRMSEKEVLDQTVTFMSAGFGTTTAAISMTLYCLAMHPEIQEKVYEEANDVLNDGELEYADLNKLRYLYMCFKEATRIFPPVAGIVKDLQEPTDVDGVTVEAGTMVVCSIYGVHHNPLVYPDPEKFDPERFNPDNGKKLDPYAWLLFSAGPRNCIGQKFADLQIKVVLAKLCQKYRFTLPENPVDLELNPAVITKAANGVNVIMTPRND